MAEDVLVFFKVPFVLPGSRRHPVILPLLQYWWLVAGGGGAERKAPLHTEGLLAMG